MQDLLIQPGGALQGSITVPGDKSITHRVIILAALQKRGTRVILRNWLQSLDCLATLNILQLMGVTVRHLNFLDLEIISVGLHGLEQPDQILESGNSGTTMRLLTGVLSAQRFSTQITGDASLCKRPMDRIIIPLTQMGAKIVAHNDRFAPLHIIGGRKLQAINYNSPVASAQVKSAILLAGLYAPGRCTVTTPSVCRDHTEIMLQYLGSVSQQNEIIMNIPGDISAAAFFMVAATVAKGSDITMPNVGINPTRRAIINILRLMGADISCSAEQLINGELRADLRVRTAGNLTAIEVPTDLIANAIDDLPILCLAAACAKGTTIIRGAAELRHKESDRIQMLAAGFTALGIKVDVFSDGLGITGGVISGAVVNSGGDHRIAMTFALAGLVANQEIMVQDTANIATSFPTFVNAASLAGLRIGEIQTCPN